MQIDEEATGPVLNRLRRAQGQPGLTRQRPGSERHWRPCEKRTELLRRALARRRRHAAGTKDPARHDHRTC